MSDAIDFLPIQVPLGQKRFVLAAKTGFCWRARHPPATLSQWKWPFVLAGGRPASTDQFVLAVHLNDRQHKCHQCWRLLKQTASTNVISAGGRLSEP
jgi:hypothetical protein